MLALVLGSWWGGPDLGVGLLARPGGPGGVGGGAGVVALGVKKVVSLILIAPLLGGWRFWRTRWASLLLAREWEALLNTGTSSPDTLLGKGYDG